MSDSIKKFSEFNINENNNGGIIEATHLISSDGMIHEIAGLIDPNKGIYDPNKGNKQYVGAIGADRKIYTTLPDMNTIVVNVGSTNYLPGDGSTFSNDPTTTEIQ